MQKNEEELDYKFCPVCRTLLDLEVKKCTHCGEPQDKLAVQKMGDRAAAWLPKWDRVPETLVFICAALAVFTMFIEKSPRTANYGSLFAPLFFHGEYWKLITYGFFHGSIAHVGFNMMALWQVGPLIERELGGARFFVLYLLTVIAGGFLEVWMQRHSATPGLILGASGGLYGLIGFGLSYGHFQGTSYWRSVRDVFLRWAIFGLVFSLMYHFSVGAIAHYAHGGGFLAGAGLGWLLERESRKGFERYEVAWRLVAWLFLLLTCWSFFELYRVLIN